MARGRNATFAALMAVALWGTNALAADMALARLSVAQLLVLQYGAATLLLVCGRLAARGRPSHHSPGRPVLPGALPMSIGIIGLTGTIFLQYLAFATAPIIAANVIAYGWPLMSAVWIAAIRRTRQALLGALLAMAGFCGVALIFGGHGIHLDGAALGYLAALGSAACMAFYTVAAARIASTATDLLVPATVIGAVAAGIASIAQDVPWPPLSAWPGALYIGIGPMAAGYGLWTYAMSGGGADRLSPIGYATPLLSTILLIATGRPFAASTLAGTALILVCTIGVLINDRVGTPVPPG